MLILRFKVKSVDGEFTLPRKLNTNHIITGRSQMDAADILRWKSVEVGKYSRAEYVDMLARMGMPYRVTTAAPGPFIIAPDRSGFMATLTTAWDTHENRLVRPEEEM